MIDLVLDARSGATAEALLGALIEAGASLEEIDGAVAALGHGDVRLQVQASDSGSALRIRAPHGAPGHETWADLRPRIALLAVDEAVATTALAILDALFAARAAVHGVRPEQVDVDPFSGPDDLANAIALAAATRSLGPDRVLATAVGHGTGTLSTIEGEVALPGPVVAELLADVGTIALDRPASVVDPVGAAYLAGVVTGNGAADELLDVEHPDGTRGRGRLDRGTSVTALLLVRPTSTAA